MVAADWRCSSIEEVVGQPMPPASIWQTWISMACHPPCISFQTIAIARQPRPGSSILSTDGDVVAGSTAPDLECHRPRPLLLVHIAHQPPTTIVIPWFLQPGIVILVAILKAPQRYHPLALFKETIAFAIPHIRIALCMCLSNSSTVLEVCHMAQEARVVDGLQLSFGDALGDVLLLGSNALQCRILHRWRVPAVGLPDHATCPQPWTAHRRQRAARKAPRSASQPPHAATRSLHVTSRCWRRAVETRL